MRLENADTMSDIIAISPAGGSGETRSGWARGDISYRLVGRGAINRIVSIYKWRFGISLLLEVEINVS